MPWVEGGSKANLVTAYLRDDDANYNYGKNRYLAQTFTISAETVLWRFVVKTWAGYPGFNYYHALANTDVYGYPVIPPLYVGYATPTGEAIYSPGKWWRWDIIQMPKLPAGRYAIILGAPSSPDWQTHKWRCDQTWPRYTEGRAFRSDDAGATWAPIANTDFMFMVYGWQPPPEPQPAPAIANWSVLNIEWYQLVDGYKIVVTTDTECHLWLRWTNVPIQIHREAIRRRGMMWYSDLRFCFVAYHENEQVEVGDTLIHTFYKRSWPVCETRWFYLVGTRAAKHQPSTSFIFEKHFQEDGWGLLIEEPWTRTIINPPGYDMLITEPWTV